VEIKKIKSPTAWSSIEEIETWIGESICEENSKGGRAKLTVIHHCGEDKQELISQLETMIYGLKNDFNDFAC
jgi:molybdenum-dependent DNA-binding transcriptional regulator ModE